VHGCPLIGEPIRPLFSRGAKRRAGVSSRDPVVDSGCPNALGDESALESAGANGLRHATRITRSAAFAAACVSTAKMSDDLDESVISDAEGYVD